MQSQEAHHTQSVPQKGAEMVSRNPVPRTQILRNMFFAKKHKKDPKKMQANNAKAMGADAETTEALGKIKALKGLVPDSAVLLLSRGFKATWLR